MHLTCHDLSHEGKAEWGGQMWNLSISDATTPKAAQPVRHRKTEFSLPCQTCTFMLCTCSSLGFPPHLSFQTQSETHTGHES